MSHPNMNVAISFNGCDVDVSGQHVKYGGGGSMVGFWEFIFFQLISSELKLIYKLNNSHHHENIQS